MTAPKNRMHIIQQVLPGRTNLLDHVHGHVGSAGGLGDQFGRDLHLTGSDVGQQSIVLVNAPILHKG